MPDAVSVLQSRSAMEKYSDLRTDAVVQTRRGNNRFFLPPGTSICMTVEADAAKTVAGLMVLAARTAPKAVGQDSIVCRVVTGKEQEKLAARIETKGKDLGFDFFSINADQVRGSDATVLIGVEGKKALGLNCGGCGFPSCAAMEKAGKAAVKHKSVYAGPNCVFKISDLGIAVGSAVKTASIHNVDNRVMFTAGVAALELGLLKGCSIAYGIPLKAAGKNPYFDVHKLRH